MRKHLCEGIYTHLDVEQHVEPLLGGGECGGVVEGVKELQKLLRALCLGSGYQSNVPLAQLAQYIHTLSR